MLVLSFIWGSARRGLGRVWGARKKPHFRHNDAHADITGTTPVLPSSRVVSPGGIPPAPIPKHTLFARQMRALKPGIAGAGPRGRCRDDPSSGAAGALDKMRNPPSHASGLGNSRDNGPAPLLVLRAGRYSAGLLYRQMEAGLGRGRGGSLILFAGGMCWRTQG